MWVKKYPTSNIRETNQCFIKIQEYPNPKISFCGMFYPKVFVGLVWAKSYQLGQPAGNLPTTDMRQRGANMRGIYKLERPTWDNAEWKMP